MAFCVAEPTRKAYWTKRVGGGWTGVGVYDVGSIRSRRWIGMADRFGGTDGAAAPGGVLATYENALGRASACRRHATCGQAWVCARRRVDGRTVRTDRRLIYGPGPRQRSCRCSTRRLPQWGQEGENPSSETSWPSEVLSASAATSAIRTGSPGRRRRSNDKSSRARFWRSRFE